jgi:hypothetical protein
MLSEARLSYAIAYDTVRLAPAISRTAGAPTAILEATLPSASTSTADGVPLAPKARPTAKFWSRTTVELSSCSLLASSEPILHPEPDGPFGWRCRAWHADHYHWRMETEVPGGGVEITASKGRRRLPIGGPAGSGLVWKRRVGAGSREEDPRWFVQATDPYWTFYPLLTDGICSISHELRRLDLTVEGTVVWSGREAVCLRGVPGLERDWEWDPDPLHWGAGEYGVVVDTERGVLLRCASRLGVRTSTPWRSRRSTSTSASARTSSPPANPYPGARDFRERRLAELQPRAAEKRRNSPPPACPTNMRLGERLCG